MNLEATRAALLSNARTEADRVVAEADRDVAAALDDARARAEREISAARAEGEQDAADRLARQRARARREARRIVLEARRGCYDELHDRARAAARDLAREHDYDDLVGRLRSLAVRQLGPDATVLVDPDAEPGLVAETESRRVDYRLVTLADRATEELSSEVAQLWT